MTLPLRVLGDRVLVRPDRLSRAPETLVSGVVIARSLAAAVTGTDETVSMSRGTVVAVGQPRHPLYQETEALAMKLEALAEVVSSTTNAELYRDAAGLLRTLVRKTPSVAVGDDVLISHNAGQQVTLDDDTFVLLHDAELLAVVE